MKYDLSIVIPARNEEWLAKTIEDILEHIEGNTEIIVVLDGQWAVTPIEQDPRVTIIYHPESVGQRAATNHAVKLSEAKYIMKVDAHCSFDQGFDVKLMNKMKDNYTMVPIMRNLHVFDWICEECGNRWYQGPTPRHCFKDYKAREENDKCNSTSFKRDIKWIAKTNPQSTSFCFDSEPHFQYFNEYKKREEYKNTLEKEGLTESMSIQGSCFMLTRDKYWELNICDEEFGSWGSQGIEVACKTWLSGGRVVANHDTYYAHLFRTQGGDFGFPYPQSGNGVQRAKKHAKELFFNRRFEGQVLPITWLLDKFWPIKGWKDEELKALKDSQKPL